MRDIVDYMSLCGLLFSPRVLLDYTLYFVLFCFVLCFCLLTLTPSLPLAVCLLPPCTGKLVVRASPFLYSCVIQVSYFRFVLFFSTSHSV